MSTILHKLMQQTQQVNCLVYKWTLTTGVFNIGSVNDQEKEWSFFLDEMSLAAAQLIYMTRLKKRTRLFLDQ